MRAVKMVICGVIVLAVSAVLVLAACAFPIFRASRKRRGTVVLCADHDVYSRDGTQPCDEERTAAV